MDTKVIIGATVAGAFGYLAAKNGAGFDDTSSIGAGLGMAIVAGGALQMTSKNEATVTGEQQDWEKELAENAESVAKEPEKIKDPVENVAGGPDKMTVKHPLMGQPVKYTHQGLVDFTQFCTLMVFTHKLAATGFAQAGRQLTIQRRAAAAAGDKEAYKNLVFQRKGMEQKYENQTMQQVFTGLKITEDCFKMTMGSYMRDPQCGPHLQQIMKTQQSVKQLTPEEGEKVEKLSKERLIEIVQVQMDIQVSSMTKMINGPPSASEQEHGMKMFLMQAQDEDAFFERTGIETENFNYQVVSTELNKDQEFLKHIDESQAKIQQVQKEFFEKQKAKQEAEKAATAEAAPKTEETAGIAEATPKADEAKPDVNLEEAD